MQKSTDSKKLVVCAVILLLFGVACLPNIYADTTPEKEFVEFTTEVYGFPVVERWQVQFNDIINCISPAIGDDEIFEMNVEYHKNDNKICKTQTRPPILDTDKNIAEKNSITTFNGNTLYVGGSGPGNYTNIQDAIDNASQGDTVFVYNGSYQEDGITINKAIMLAGENKSTTYIDGNYSEGITILVTSSDVTIREFTLRNCLNGGFGQAFYLWGDPYLENICISNCIMENNDKGIFFINIRDIAISSCHFHYNPGQSVWGKNSTNISITQCVIHNNGKDLGGGWFRNGGLNFYSIENESYSNISVFNCDIYDNYGWGIYIESTETKDVLLYNNSIYRNTMDGICSFRIKNFEIFNNLIQENNVNGIYVKESENVNIYNNHILRNGGSIDFLRSTSGIGLNSISSLTLCNNTILYNNCWGIAIYCDSAFISGNNLTNNTFGVFLFDSNNNTISDNRILKSEFGILLWSDSNFNIISSNLISKNINGTSLFYSGKNIISGNEILDNENGIFLRDVEYPDTQIIGKHKIEFNNFINNNRDAFFRIEPRGFLHIFRFFSEWNNNYWDKPMIIPKLIFGTINTILFHFFPWVQFDLRPASKPYDLDRAFQ